MDPARGGGRPPEGGLGGTVGSVGLKPGGRACSPPGNLPISPGVCESDSVKGGVVDMGPSVIIHIAETETHDTDACLWSW